MNITSRFSLALFAFLFAAGTGAAFASSSAACKAACNAELSACLSDAVGSGKTACVAQGKACEKQCKA